jgi:hypothetical protein
MKRQTIGCNRIPPSKRRPTDLVTTRLIPRLSCGSVFSVNDGPTSDFIRQESHSFTANGCCSCADFSHAFGTLHCCSTVPGTACVTRVFCTPASPDSRCVNSPFRSTGCVRDSSCTTSCPCSPPKQRSDTVRYRAVPHGIVRKNLCKFMQIRVLMYACIW